MLANYPVTLQAAIACVAGAAICVLLRKKGRGLIDCVAGAGAVVLLSMLLSGAISLMAVDRLDYRITITATLITIAIFAWQLSTTLSAPFEQERSWCDRVVGFVALAVAFLTFGRQFEYASFWGDIGIYQHAILHYSFGGSVTFPYQSLANSIASVPAPLEPPAGINPAGVTGYFQFHANPLWPAFAALCGGSRVLAILFGLAIIQFYRVAIMLFKARFAAMLATMLLATLPLAWHQALYATAEMLLLAIATSTLYLAMSSRRGALWAAAGAFCYGLAHISVFLLAPLFAAILTVAAITGDGNKRMSAATQGIALALAVLGAVYLSTLLSIRYAADIFKSVSGGHEWLVWMACASPCIAALPWLVRKAELQGIPGPRESGEAIAKWLPTLSRWVVVAYALLAIAGIYVLGWTDKLVPEVNDIYNSFSARTVYVNRGLESLRYSGIVNLTMASAWLGMAAFVCTPFLLHKRGKEIGKEATLVWLSAAYCVLLFGVLRLDIPNNYYASRYFLPLAVPALLLASVPILEKFAWARTASIAVGFCSLLYVSDLIGSGFFLRERQVKQMAITEQVSGRRNLYFLGSDWLRYMAAADLMRLNTESAAPGESEGGNQAPLLLTDASHVIGGTGKCVENFFPEIPWQIEYPTKALLVQRRICTVEADGMGGVGRWPNTWMENGKLAFVVVGGTSPNSAVVEIDSLGWWASQKPFANNLQALRPALTVCGEKFDLITMQPSKVRFAGTIRAPFCEASLQTSTFSPAAVGSGADTRMLGMDANAIRVIVGAKE